MTALWERFDRMVLFDTETTGVRFGKDRIIEIGAVALEAGTETGGMDLLLRLPEGQRLDPFITELTGITGEQLEAEGVGDMEAAKAFAGLLEGAERPLVAAYHLEDRAVNSHRAIDDDRAAALLLEAMAEEDDLARYVGLFGTHPKYGMSGRKIPSVT